MLLLALRGQHLGDIMSEVGVTLHKLNSGDTCLPKCLQLTLNFRLHDPAFPCTLFRLRPLEHSSDCTRYLGKPSEDLPPGGVFG
jgi:hypothetical protein